MHIRGPEHTLVIISLSAATLAGWMPIADAQSATSLAYIPGSSVKLEQVIGDCDLQDQAKQIVAGQPVTCVPTTSQTITRFNIAGNDNGRAFEANGKLF